MIRTMLKGMMFAVCVVLTSPALGIVWLEKQLGGGEAWFATFAQWLALLPGSLGVQLRAAYYFGTLERCDWQVHIGFGTILMHRAARLGPHVSTGSYCVLGHANIGERVRIASRVSVPSGKRQHVDDAGALSEATRFDTVSIGAGTWVGEGAIVLADVARGCIVSAGAVVLQPIPETCIVGGNPAKVLRALPERQPAAVTG
jgi:virginiamycin A acetyltransferase